MTYGEAHVAEMQSLTLVKGVWKKTLNILNKPEKMPKDKAAKYYNKKFYKYWLTKMSKRHSLALSKKKLNYLMFRDTKERL